MVNANISTSLIAPQKWRLGQRLKALNPLSLVWVFMQSAAHTLGLLRSVDRWPVHHLSTADMSLSKALNPYIAEGPRHPSTDAC